jgi:MFS family permease
VLQFFIPAEGGLIPKIVDRKYILFANSLFSLTAYTTTAVGIAFSGLILNLFGIKWTFSICALLFIISAVFVYFINIEGIKTENNKIRLIYFIKLIPAILNDIKEGINYAFRTKILRFILFHLFLVQIVSFTLVTISFRIGNEIYGVSPRTAGIIIFAPVMVGLLTGIAALNIFGRFKNRIKLILIGTLTSICGFGCIMVIAVLKIFLFNMFIDKMVTSMSLIIIGFSIPFLLIPAQTLMHENTKDNFRGRILGIWVALTLSLASIVATFVGFLADRMDNIFIAVLCLAIFAILYSGVILLLLKRKLLC